jgi:hypothetical protein
MPFYLVTLPTNAVTPLVGNARSRVVHAASVADARVAAAASVSFDGDTPWGSATVTELAASQDLAGVEFRATITPDADNYARTFSAVGKAAIAAATCTITIATPGIITLASHGFEQGDPVIFATGDTLPTGITAGTTYYVNKLTDSTFAISAKFGGSSIATSVSQAGAHTVRRVDTTTVTGLLTQLAAVLNGSALIDLGTDVAASGLVLTIHADSKVGDRTIAFGAYLGEQAVAGIIGTVNATGAEGSNRTITISGGSMEGVRMRITMADATNPLDLSVFMHAGETLDLAAARLLVLVNAHALIGGTDGTYTAGTQTFSFPADNNVGDNVIACTFTRDGALIPELPVTINAVGAAGSVRTIILAADGTLPVPQRPVVLATVATV